MNKWMALGMGLAMSAGFSPQLWAQLPAAPAAGAVAPAAGAVAPVAGQAGGFFGGLKGLFAGCKQKFCASPLGGLVNNALGPVSALSGGLIGSCCPAVNPADLAQPGAVGAAAKIKEEEAKVKAKRAAIRFLGTVDCHWWPEAQAALIGALRAERNECVRLEAALALGRGCCCTKATMKALLVTVNGTEEDGNFAENSDRVKAAAAAALAHCLSCYHEVHAAAPPPVGGGKVPTTQPSPERKLVEKELEKAGMPPYYIKINQVTWAQLASQAEKTLAKTTTSVAPPGTVTKAPKGTGHSVAEILSKAVNPEKTKNGRLQPTPMGESAEPMVVKSTPVTRTERVVVTTVTPATPSHVVWNSMPPAPPSPVVTTSYPTVTTGPVVKNTPPAFTTGPVVMNTTPTVPADPMVGSTRPLVTSSPLVMNTAPAASPSSSSYGGVSGFGPSQESRLPWFHRRKPTPQPETVVMQDARPVGTPTSSFAGLAVVSSKPVGTQGSGSMGQGVKQVSYQVASPAPKASAATPTQGPEATGGAIVNHKQMLALLRESIYPEQREWAADNLASFNWKISPEIVDSLLDAVRKDRVTAVRVASLRCLMKINANTPQVLATVRFLQTDNDPKVRAQADETLAKLSSGTAGTVIQLHN